MKGVGVKTTVAILLTIVVPAVITLSVVTVPTRPLDFTLESAPYGYTISLLIYLVPVLAMYVWFRRRYREPGRETDDRRSAYRWTLMTLIPLGFLLDFRSTRAYVNWRAVSFAVLWVVLTSLIWEATLAIPYGWWGYKEWHMLGLFIDAWTGLPLEAALVWLAATFTTVTIYEMFKIRSAAKRLYGRGWWETFFGSTGATEPVRT